MRATLLRLFFGICFGIAAAACEDEEETDYYNDICITIAASSDTCHNQPYECDVDPCASACTNTGHKAAKHSDTCDKLWRATLECIEALTCEQLMAWEDGQWGKTPDYPCEEPELDFRAACPDLPLFGNEL